MADHQVAHANLVDGSFAGQLLLDRPGRKETGESVAVLGVPLAPAHESLMAGLGFLGQNGVEDVVEGYRFSSFICLLPVRRASRQTRSPSSFGSGGRTCQNACRALVFPGSCP